MGQLRTVLVNENPLSTNWFNVSKGKALNSIVVEPDSDCSIGMDLFNMMRTMRALL